MLDALAAALFFVATAGCADRSAADSERLTPGIYTSGQKGVYRRIVVTQSPTIPYDIWRADPHGIFTHLHYTLVSPKPFPVESTEYNIDVPGKTCEHLTLRLYREQNKVHPEIIVLSFGSYDEPFASNGEGLTTKSYRDDALAVATLRRNASDPGFYDTTPYGSRGAMLDGVPNCH